MTVRMKILKISVISRTDPKKMGHNVMMTVNRLHNFKLPTLARICNPCPFFCRFRTIYA